MNTVRGHIFFWIAVIVALTAVFGNAFNSHILSFYFVSMLLPVAIGTSYFFNYFLVPRYLLKERYGRFLLYLSYLLIVSTWLEMWVITGSYVLLADFNIRALSPIVTNIFLLAIILYFIVFLKAFLLLVRRQWSSQARARTANLLARRLSAEQNKLLNGYLNVRTDRRQARIGFGDILYAESMGDYVRIHTQDDDTVVTRERIGELADKLPVSFLRIHRSIVVNSRKVDRFSRTEVRIGETTLPVSRTYKQEVYGRLSGGESAAAEI